jgi:hypothetical protein
MMRRAWAPEWDRVPPGWRSGCAFVPVAVLAFYLLTLALSWCQDRYGGESWLYVNLLLLLSWVLIGPLYLLFRGLDTRPRTAEGEPPLPPVTGGPGPVANGWRPNRGSAGEAGDVEVEAAPPDEAAAHALTCPYCRYALREGEKRVNCPRCGAPHHLECWRANGGCTTYGCRGKA